MKYTRIAPLKKDISRIVLGTVNMKAFEPADRFRLLDAFVEAGGNAFDTAHNYGGNSNAIGEWFRQVSDRDRLVIFDKVCHPYGSPRFGVEFLDGDHAENLERLQVDYVDFCVFHRDEPSVDLAPILQRLNEHRAAGTMHGFGGSNWTTDRIDAANRIAKEHGLQGFSLNNPNLSLAAVNEPMWGGCVTVDEAGRQWHEANQLPLLSWSSGAGGFFADVVNEDIKRVYHNEVNFGRLERLKAMAKQKGVTPVQLALAWVLNQPFPTLAIVTCADVDQVRQNCAAADIELTPAEVRHLEHGH